MAELLTPYANDVPNGSTDANDNVTTESTQLHQRQVVSQQNGPKPQPAVMDSEQEIEEAEGHDLIEADAIDYEVYSFKWSEIVWPMIIKLSILHILGFHGLYSALTGKVLPQTMIWTFIIGPLSALGTSAGVHRLWCHRSYKGAWPLRVFLAYLHSMTLQYSIYEWARDHRVHHKYTETNADPHNAHRGFFFSHIGWLMVRKHPDVIAAGKKINMDDIWADPIVRFQKRFFVPCAIVAWGLVPTLVPVYFWGEDWYMAFSLACGFRSVVVLHHIFMINSVAHMFGMRPFNENIGARDNRQFSHILLGEGYHNYHHTFPWDYSSVELGLTRINATTLLIDLFSKLGWAYNRRKATAAIVEARRLKTKDGRLEAPMENPYRPLFILEWLICFTLPITLGFAAKFIVDYFRHN